MVVPPQVKDMKDAAVQSEVLREREENLMDRLVSTAGEGFGKVFFFCTSIHMD